MSLKEIGREIQEIMVKSGLFSFHVELTTEDGRVWVSAGDIGAAAPVNQKEAC